MLFRRLLPLLLSASLGCEVSPSDAAEAKDGAAGDESPLDTSPGEDASLTDLAPGADVASPDASSEIGDPETPDAGPKVVALALSVTRSLDEKRLVATVEGALPGAAVLLYGSTDPLAPPSCPEVLAPECLALGAERVVANGVADGQGVVVLEHPLDGLAPEGATSGDPFVLRLQAGSWSEERGWVSPVAELSLTAPVEPPPPDLDTDFDGLSDAVEATLGTDVKDPDSDDDALLDGQEVAAGTDPKNPDTDGDGWGDGYELLAGLSPLDPEPQPPNPGGCAFGMVPIDLAFEVCDGLDNDCDGLVDEGLNGGDDDGDGVLDCAEGEDCDCVDDDGDGRIAEHCRYPVTVATSSYTGSIVWLDGQMLPNVPSRTEGTSQHLLVGGAHALAVQGVVPTSYAGGVRASVRAGGQMIATTGGPGWWMSSTPTAAWRTEPPGGPAPAVVTGVGCFALTWNTPTLTSDGAATVWGALTSGGCPAATADLKLRTELLLCGNIETCDGADNDGDGVVDEGQPDTDGDGLCDGLDWEVCDGLDNDGDGLIDDGIADADGDGLCDLRDSESCDGLDNDGDGAIDESPDLNGDGISDCGQVFCEMDEPMLAVLGTHELVRVNPLAGTHQLLGNLGTEVGGLVITSTKEVFAIGRAGGHMHLYRVDVTQPPVLRHVRDLGIVYSYSGMGHLDGGIAELSPGELVLGWDGSVYRYDVATDVLAPLLSHPRLEQVRELTWYRGELWIVGWFAFDPATNDGGPKVLRWNRLNDTLVQELGPELILNAGSSAQMRPVSMAVDGQSRAYLNMEYSFQTYNGVETNSVYRYDPPTRALTRLFRIAAYPQPKFLAAATFIGNTDCQRDIEACDGLDNDGNGLTDEGFDANQDGFADCTYDDCDGVDDDGDGQTDEDAPDADGDAICDAFDAEGCDGLDNDGDGIVDYVDIDGDGDNDCKTEPCDLLPVAWFTSGFANGVSVLRRLDLGANVSTTLNTLDRWLGDVAVTPDYRLLGAGITSSSEVGIYQVRPGNAHTTLIGTAGPVTWSFYAELGIAVDAAGQVYIGVATEVRRWNPYTGLTALVANAPGNIQDLAFRRGVLWAITESQILRLDPGATTMTQVAYLPGYPHGLTAGPAGELLVGILTGSSNNIPILNVDAATGANSVRAYLPFNVYAYGLGAVRETCEASFEACDGLDNDLDGEVDDGWPDTDADGIPDCRDTETCDCLDNDGDKQVDEGCSYELTVQVAADDVATVFIDGQPVGVATASTFPASFTSTVGAGTHRIGLAVESLTAPAAGVLAAVYLDGQVLAKTGDPVFRRVKYAAGWWNQTSSVSGVAVASPPWPGPAGLVATGAQWIWGPAPTGPAWLGTRAFTAQLPICGAPLASAEVCDGLDNNLDGAVDEGFPDADGSGSADCAEVETVCDGLDDDGDGEVDEGFPDTDADGVADCVDPEVCDGLDNDGNGLIDDGPDSDQDGIPDCLDVEACDSLDNDGDGQTDEGFDSDQDGIPDCLDVETCDGVDNDGDGLVDEGFPDLNGDGIPDCNGVEPCNCKDDDGDGFLDEGCRYPVALSVTGMDRWTAWLDGQPWGTDANWTTIEHLAGTLIGGGRHHVAVLVEHGSSRQAGFIAVARLNGQIVGRTGTGQFRVGIPPLSLGWQTNPASGWGPDAIAGNASWPGGQLLSAQLAKWVWSVDATDPAAWPVNAYILPIDVCGERDWPPVELCNGVDDDGDGLADEGFPDGDADGIADCADEEGACDGLDEDGDGAIDEGFPDADLDGVADCVDPELCNGVDDDGDGQIDEGYLDTTGDGVPDCIVDVPVETICDCLDDDGDGIIDEGCTSLVDLTIESTGSAIITVDGKSYGKATGIQAIQATLDRGVLHYLAIETGGAARVRLKVDGSPLPGVTSWTAGSTAEPGWQTKLFPNPAVTPSCGWPKDGALAGEAWLWSGPCELLSRTIYLVRPLSICEAVE